MKGKKIKKVCVPLLGLLAILMLIVVDYIVNNPKEVDPTKKQSASKLDSYNDYGLPVGTELKKQPFYQDDTLVLYEDRVFKTFHYEDTNIQNTVKIAQELEKSLPEEISLYMVPLPGRVVLEEGYEEDKKRYEEFLSALKSQLPSKSEFVDVLPELAKHQEEYLFFRDENGWTARGAYYGSKAMCESMGIQPFPLEGYEEHMYKTFRGAFWLDTTKLFEEGTENARLILNVPGEPVCFYLLPGSQNLEEVGWTKEGKSIVEKRPTIRKSEAGTAAFVGWDHEWAVIEGDAKSKEKKDESLLLISDRTGNLLAPYFANYYKQVYVINTKEYRGLDTKINDICQEYQVKDVVLAQMASDMGSEMVSRALNGFVSNEN